MKFVTAFYVFTYAVALWAFVVMALFVQLHPVGIGIFLLFITLAALRDRLSMKISSSIWLVISLIVLMLALYGWFIMMERLYAVVYTFLYLEINKLWTGTRNRDYLQVYGLTFFQMIAAAVSTASLIFAPALVIYLFLILGALFSVTMKGDAERVMMGSSHKGQPPVRPDHSKGDALAGEIAGAPFLTRRMLGTMGVTLVAILAIGSGLFYMIPRLQAQSFVTGINSSRNNRQVSGFSESVDFVGIQSIQTDNTIAARAIPESGYIMNDGYPRPSLLRLRGTALDLYDGRRWDKSNELKQRAINIGPRRDVELNSTAINRPNNGVLATTIHLESNSSSFLFAPGLPTHFGFESPVSLTYDPISESVQVTRGRWSNTLSYRVQSVLQPEGRPEEQSEEPNNLQRANTIAQQVEASVALPLQIMNRLITTASSDFSEFDWDRMRSTSEFYLQLPDHPDTETAREMSNNWVAEVQSPWEKAKQIEMKLKSDFTYSLEIPFSGAFDHVTQFLTVARAGHCEYFATSMVLMLRTQGIPSRIVNGYATDEWVGGGSSKGYFLVRNAHAHSWVEAYIPDLGWTTFDPTPISGLGSNRLPNDYFIAMSRWVDQMKFLWYDAVIDYDANDQTFLYHAFFKGMEYLKFDRLKDRLALAFGSEGGGIGTPKKIILGIILVAAMGLMVLLFLEFRKKSIRKELDKGYPTELRESPRIEAYLEVLKAAKSIRPRSPAETPREYAEQLVQITPALLPFATLTEVYYSSRFNGRQWSADDTKAAKELIRLIREVKSTEQSTGG